MQSVEHLVGQTLGQYRIIEKIGVGGMAAVFKAYQPNLKREVALKVLPPYFAHQSNFTERFAREAQAIANLYHPNILPVYDSGQDKGYSYMVMRYIPNARTLADLMQQPLPLDQIGELITQIGSALDYAHKAGIIHRDVKPSNVLMDGEWALLSDFGIAKILTATSELTGAGVGIGTPAYMSPEQCQGKQVDQRTDIYALGIILYEMLTRQVPHQAETPIAIVIKRINEPVPSPRHLNSSISRAVEQVVLKALAADISQRFNSAGELSANLRTALTGEPAGEQDYPATVISRKELPPSLPSASRSLPEPVLPQPRPAWLHPPEIVTLTLLGIAGLCGIGGSLLSFIPNQETGQLSLGMLPPFLGLIIAAATSAGLLWLRRKARLSSPWSALAVLPWFSGLVILGMGGFAAATPGQQDMATNLGFTALFCLVPGGLLALLGLLLYGYDYRRTRHTGQASIVPGLSKIAGPASDHSAKLERAREYRNAIIELIKRKKKAGYHLPGDGMTARVDQWVVRVSQLVQRLEVFEADQVLQRDLREVPAAVVRLETRLKREPDLQLQAQVRETLLEHRAYQDQLQALLALMHRTGLEIDETLASMGTIYSQLQLLEAKDLDQARASRLSDDIDEQVQRLNDVLTAMEETYQERSLAS